MNERQKQNLKFQTRRKKRGATLAAVLCFMAAIAMVGTYTLKDYQKTQKKQQAKLEEAAQAEAANADEIVNSEIKKAPVVADHTTDILEEEAEDVVEEEMYEVPDVTVETTGKETAIHFGKNDKLLWPVEGHLLMNYSMDKTVYFSTLDQFKYNPALVISGEKKDQVISSAPGIVKSIDRTAETGTTVNVDIGDGYELFYGQLSDVQVKTGDKIESKTVLGYVGDPTMYYSVEGSNVYFEMRKDGQPINPMDFLVE